MIKHDGYPEVINEGIGAVLASAKILAEVKPELIDAGLDNVLKGTFYESDEATGEVLEINYDEIMRPVSVNFSMITGDFEAKNPKRRHISITESGEVIFHYPDHFGGSRVVYDRVSGFSEGISEKRQSQVLGYVAIVRAITEASLTQQTP